MSLDAPSIGARRQAGQSRAAGYDRTSQARAFLRALFGAAPAGVFVGLVRKNDGKPGDAFGRIEWRPPKPDNLDELARLAVHWRDDVYVNVAPMSTSRRRKVDCAALVCLWHELDGADAPARLDALEAVVGRCSVVVGSGGGQHAYWLLAAPVTGAEAIEATLAAWRARLDALGAIATGEGVHDAARVLRVPGTFNAKPERQDSAGNAPAVQLLRCEPGTRYAVAELVPLMIDAPISVRPATTAPASSPVTSTAYGRAALTGERVRLSEVAPGGRHNAAVRAGFRLGQIAERHGLDVGAVVAALLAACDANGLTRDDGQPAARRAILDGWSAGLAAPSDRGTGAEGVEWAAHVDAVKGWTDGAAEAIASHGKRRTRTTDSAVVVALGDIAIAAGPGCASDGAVVVDASRHRLGRLTGYAPETCRRTFVRLTALGAVELATAGGLRGYDVALGRARKVSNGWRLRFVQSVAEMSYEVGAGDAPDAPTESTGGIGGNPPPLTGNTTATHCTNPPRLGPAQDPLTAALTTTGAAILRALLDAGRPMTAHELAEAVGCSRSTAHRHAVALRSHGSHEVVRAAGQRVNPGARPSPLFVATVGSEAEAIAETSAEAVQAALVARRDDDWRAMSEHARRRTAAAYARRVNAEAGQYRKQAPAEVVELAGDMRRAPMTSGAMAAARRVRRVADAWLPPAMSMSPAMAAAI